MKISIQVHQNYMIEDKNKNICFLSVVSTDVNDRHIPLYKVILWTKMVLKRLFKISEFVKKHYKYTDNNRARKN